MSERSDDLRRRKINERDRRIVERWLERPRGHRAGDADVLAFYVWLNDHQPTLIPAGPKSYQYIHALVEPHFVKRVQ